MKALGILHAMYQGPAHLFSYIYMLWAQGRRSTKFIGVMLCSIWAQTYRREKMFIPCRSLALFILYRLLATYCRSQNFSIEKQAIAEMQSKIVGSSSLYKNGSDG